MSSPDLPCREWSRFAKILFLTLGLPLLLVLAACELLCWYTGELVPDRVAAQRQAANPRLVWFAHNDADAVRFKLIRAAQIQPQVLVMGTSRSSQFRAAMFQPYRFYNLGRVAWPIFTMRQLLERLPPDHPPKVIFFVIDFFEFNPRFDSDPKWSHPVFTAPLWKTHLESLQNAFLDLFHRNPLAILHRPRYPTLGLAAYWSKMGFRPDGSEALFDWEALSAGRGTPDPADFPLQNINPLLYGDAMGAKEMQDLRDFVQFARARGITPIAVQLPIYQPLRQALERSPHYGILRDYEKQIAAGYFDQLGIIFFNFLDFPPYSNDYRYFDNLIHPSQVTSAAVALKISQDPRVKALLPQWDTADLQARLEKNQTDRQHIFIYGTPGSE